MNTKLSKRKTGGRVGRSNERVLQRDRLLRQAKHLPGVADVVDVTRQSVFDNEAEEVGKAAAVIEERTGEETVQLIADRFRARYLDHELIFTHGSLRYIRLNRLRL